MATTHGELKGTNGKGVAWTYLGGIKDGRLMHGRGTMTWASGDRYEGDFEKDLYHGRGTFTWADGRRYEGEWEKNLRHGRGVYRFGGGRGLFDGAWARDFPQREGTAATAGGDVYRTDVSGKEDLGNAWRVSAAAAAAAWTRRLRACNHYAFLRIWP